jgi:hypothetical protein
MNKENIKNNKKDKKNEKTSKKVIRFALSMFVSFIAGALFSLLVSFAEDKGIDFGTIFNNIDNYAVYALPWLFVGILIIGGGICLAYYLKAKKAFAKWDGEDEDSISKIELMLSKVAVISNIALILDYFFIAAWLHFSVSDTVTVSDKMLIINSIISIVTFLATLVFGVAIQRCSVELEKKINPEKRGEVLDANFQKDWEASFDEAEKIMAGKAAYKSFKLTNGTCVALWLISVIGQVMFNIGIVPALFVTVIWLVSTVSYQVEAIKLENKK